MFSSTKCPRYLRREHYKSPSKNNQSNGHTPPARGQFLAYTACEANGKLPPLVLGFYLYYCDYKSNMRRERTIVQQLEIANKQPFLFCALGSVKIHLKSFASTDDGGDYRSTSATRRVPP